MIHRVFIHQPTQAFHLNTGWQCARICHLCTAADWHDPRDSSKWHTDGPGPTPFKPGASSPLLDVPGCNQPRHVQLDFCHAFHLGCGIDMAASTIVLLAKLGHFGPARKLNQRLGEAYSRFSSWCAANCKVTSINRFSKLDFDMTVILPNVM